MLYNNNVYVGCTIHLPVSSIIYKLTGEAVHTNETMCSYVCAGIEEGKVYIRAIGSNDIYVADPSIAKINSDYIYAINALNITEISVAKDAMQQFEAAKAIGRTKLWIGKTIYYIYKGSIIKDHIYAIGKNSIIVELFKDSVPDSWEWKFEEFGYTWFEDFEEARRKICSRLPYNEQLVLVGEGVWETRFKDDSIKYTWMKKEDKYGRE